MGFSLRRCARLTATLGTGVLTVWIIAALGSLGQTDFRNSDAAMLLENGDKALLSVDSNGPDSAHVMKTLPRVASEMALHVRSRSFSPCSHYNQKNQQTLNPFIGCDFNELCVAENQAL